VCVLALPSRGRHHESRHPAYRVPAFLSNDRENQPAGLGAMTIRKLAVTWEGLLTVLFKLTSKWQPPRLKNEAAYRDHLLELIRSSVPSDTKVEKEYRHHGTTIDIWVRWTGLLFSGELALELKVNLRKKAEFDRLVGQIESLNPEANAVLVVLIGETDRSLLGRLQDKYSRFIKPPAGTTPTLAIVEISITTNAL